MTRQISAERLANSLQELVAATGMVTYFTHTVTAVSVGRWILVAAGVLLFVGTLVVGRRVGTAHRSAWEPIAVAAVGWLAFGMPVAGLPSPRGPGFISAGIGLATFYVLWGTLRYEVLPRKSEGLARNLSWGLGWGAGFAAALSLIALVIVARAEGGASGAPKKVDLLPYVLGAYWVAGIVGGLLVGLLRPFTGWPVARIAVGVLVGFCAYGAMALAMGVSGDPAFGGVTLREQGLVALIAGLGVGPPVALGAIDLILPRFSGQ